MKKAFVLVLALLIAAIFPISASAAEKTYFKEIDGKVDFGEYVLFVDGEELSGEKLAKANKKEEEVKAVLNIDGIIAVAYLNGYEVRLLYNAGDASTKRIGSLNDVEQSEFDKFLSSIDENVKKQYEQAGLRIDKVDTYDHVQSKFIYMDLTPLTDENAYCRMCFTIVNGQNVYLMMYNENALSEKAQEELFKMVDSVEFTQIRDSSFSNELLPKEAIIWVLIIGIAIIAFIILRGFIKNRYMKKMKEEKKD